MPQPARYITASTGGVSCVHVALTSFENDPQMMIVTVADSKDWSQPPVLFYPDDWETFTRAVVDGAAPAYQVGPLRFEADEWDTFVKGVRDGKFTVGQLSA
jgi:hypothetical protein